VTLGHFRKFIMVLYFLLLTCFVTHSGALHMSVYKSRMKEAKNNKFQLTPAGAQTCDESCIFGV
jgi:hypothetical protein